MYPSSVPLAIAHPSIIVLPTLRLSQFRIMLSQCQPVPPTNPTISPNTDPFINYSRSLHNYTLRLWTESRRLAEEKARVKTDKKEADEQRERRASHIHKP
jgi:hypothetical protein